MRMGGWCRRFDITVITLLSMSFEIVLLNHPIRALDIFNCIQSSDWLFLEYEYNNLTLKLDDYKP